jgi:hypothetical protein
MRRLSPTPGPYGRSSGLPQSGPSGTNSGLPGIGTGRPGTGRRQTALP